MYTLFASTLEWNERTDSKCLAKSNPHFLEEKFLERLFHLSEDFLYPFSLISSHTPWSPRQRVAKIFIPQSQFHDSSDQHWKLRRSCNLLFQTTGDKLEKIKWSFKIKAEIRVWISVNMNTIFLNWRIFNFAFLSFKQRYYSRCVSFQVHHGINQRLFDIHRWKWVIFEEFKKGLTKEWNQESIYAENHGNLYIRSF